MKAPASEHQELISQLERLHEEGEHQEIVEKLQQFEATEKSYTLTGLFARALNNVSRYEEAIDLLQSISEQGQNDEAWQFRMGYALFYLDGRETESIPYFERAIELGDDHPGTYQILLHAKSFLEEDSKDEHQFEFTPKAFAQLSLNMRLQPKHRATIEDTLDYVLQSKKLGCVSGGGTQISKEREPEMCDIELDLVEYSEEMRDTLLSIAEKLDIAKDSNITYYAPEEENEDEFDLAQSVGNLVGLGIYINKAEIPEEESEGEGLSDVYHGLIDVLLNNGALIPSYGQNAQEVALYFYTEGKYESLLEKADKFLNQHPLGKTYRAIRLA